MLEKLLTHSIELAAYLLNCELLLNASLKNKLAKTGQCTEGDEGVRADLSSESISAHTQGLPAPDLQPATTWSGQIWILNSTPF